jgi:hypothetical protein
MKRLLVLILVTFAYASAQNLHYLNLDELDATPAVIKVSPNMSAVIEFQENITGGLPLREDWFTYNIDNNLVYVDAKVEVGEASFTIRVNGKTALFVAKADMSLTRPNNYVVRSPFQAEPKTVTTLRIPSLTLTPEASAAPTNESPKQEPIAQSEAVPNGTAPSPNDKTLTPSLDNEGATAQPGVAANGAEESKGNDKWEVILGEGLPYAFYARLDYVGNEPHIRYKLESKSELDFSNDITRLYLSVDGERQRYEVSRQDANGIINRLGKKEVEMGTLWIPTAMTGPIELTWTLVQYTTNQEFVIRAVLR